MTNWCFNNNFNKKNSCVHSWWVIKYRLKTTWLILYQMESESVNKRRECVKFFMRSSFSHWGKQNIQADQIDMHSQRSPQTCPSPSPSFSSPTATAHIVCVIPNWSHATTKTSNLSRHVNGTRSFSHFITVFGQTQRWMVAFKSPENRSSKSQSSSDVHGPTWTLPFCYNHFGYIIKTDVLCFVLTVNEDQREVLHSAPALQCYVRIRCRAQRDINCISNQLECTGVLCTWQNMHAQPEKRWLKRQRRLPSQAAQHQFDRL